MSAADGIPWLDGPALRAALPMADAIDALESAFDGEDVTAPPRAHHAVPGGDLLLMPAAGPAGTGVKLVTVAPGNPARGLPLIAGVYVLFAPGTLQPVALVEAAALTALRTAAVSGLAARHLARADAAHLVLFGAGTQARSHVEALRAVRPVERVTVVSRTASRAADLVEELRGAGLRAELGAPADVRDADLVACCTTSPTPVLAGADLPPGVHVTAVGAYTPDTRELDTLAMRRGRIVVEERAAALAEAGDLCIPIAEGALTSDDIVADLREVVRGTAVREAAEDITVFKSVGLAMEDLAVVGAALAGAARE
jgi:ornithine cyclodeaminase/alanine dehydrogenase-like protein (mu-crystallin family)